MREVVFISPVFPFPVDNGKKVVVSGILEYLIERYGAENVTYILLSSDERYRHGRMPCKCLTLRNPSSPRRVWNVLGSILSGKSKSLQELMLYSAELSQRLQDIVTGMGPELIVCDTLRTGQFFETADRTEGSYVLYMDDLFSVRYRKTLEVLERFPGVRLNLLGNFARFVPSPLRPLARMKSLQKGFLRLEQRLVAKRERECIKWFDNNLLINEEEAKLLRERTGNPYVKSIKPLLTDVGARAERRYEGEPVFVFLGALNIPHNQLSIAHFVKNQIDEVSERMPNARLRIIGGGGNGELEQLVGRYRGTVSVEGFVDDLDTVLGESCAMIIPLLFGSGVKIKTLEALSRGLPIISTSFGVEGIPLTSGADCIVENNISRYPQLMSELTEVSYNTRLSRRAREFYLENYSRDEIFREYDGLFRERAGRID